MKIFFLVAGIICLLATIALLYSEEWKPMAILTGILAFLFLIIGVTIFRGEKNPQRLSSSTGYQPRGGWKLQL